MDAGFQRRRLVLGGTLNKRTDVWYVLFVGVILPDASRDRASFPDRTLRSQLPTSSASSPTWRAMSAQPEVRAGVLAALVDSLASSGRPGDEVAQLMDDLLARQAVDAVTLYKAAADGSLRLVGQWGVPRDLVSSWHRIPPVEEVPYVKSLTAGRSYFFADRATRASVFPGVTSTSSAFEATATIPIHDAGTPIGVVGLVWFEAQSFDEERRAATEQLVQRVGHVLLRHASEVDTEFAWLQALMILQLDPWLVLDSGQGIGGDLCDLIVRDVSPQAKDAHTWIGRRLIEIWPSTATDGLGQDIAALLRTGGHLTTEVAIPSPAPWGTTGSRVRVARLGRFIVLVWRPVLP